MRLLFAILLVAATSYATSLIKIKEYSLQKDETKKLLVKYGSSQKLFTMRWTLYKNDALVLFSSYDRIVSQHLLYLNHTNQSFRVELKPRGASAFNPPYILVRFDEFDFAKRRAKISIWLYDIRQEVYIKYLN